MNAKEQFATQKELREWWSAIAVDPRFDRVLLHASGAALEALPSEQERNGVLKFKDILLTLADAEAGPVQFARPGLLHDITNTRPSITQPETKQPTK